MKTKNIIKLEHAQVGQILALDVNDMQGNCLMAEGVVLNENTIKSLLQRGVDTLVVWGKELNQNEMVVQQKAIKGRLSHRFRKVQNNSEMCLLHDILLRWRLDSDEPEAGDS